MKKERPVSDIVEEDDRIHPDSPDERVVKEEGLNRHQDAVDRMPKKLRAALVIVRLQDMKYREAEVLDV